jgi:hypothetical protein
LQGAAEDGLTVYRGIPFAAAPVGELRWRVPQPAVKWDGVRETVKFAPDPYQGDGKGNVSEDCLYLNIWTPAKSSGDRIPVLSVDLWRWLLLRLHVHPHAQRGTFSPKGHCAGQYQLPCRARLVSLRIRS